jgi:hypothetical protein
MNSPIDDDFEDRLKYVPSWARRPAAPKDDAQPRPAEPPETPPSAPERFVGLRDRADPPPVANGSAIAPIDQPAAWSRAPAQVFEGDRAMRELRTRMTLDPQFVPEPPQSSPRRSIVRRLIRLCVIAGFAAGVAYLLVLFGFLDAKGPVQEQGAALKSTLAGKGTDWAASLIQSRGLTGRLALLQSRSAVVNEAVPLGVSFTGGPDDGAVVVSGLAEGAQLSTGLSLEGGSWRVPLADLARATLAPPRDFVGVMNLVVELRSTDGASIDKGPMRIEWTKSVEALSASAPAQPDADEKPRAAVSPAPSGNPAVDPEEIAMLVKRGEAFIADGDLASARLVLRRAAESGDAQAALLLGSTYDPATFKKLKVLGSAPDALQARAWYQRAADRGSAEAARRLEPLAQGAR